LTRRCDAFNDDDDDDDAVDIDSRADGAAAGSGTSS
jgi:hypothetical protein